MWWKIVMRVLNEIYYVNHVKYVIIWGWLCITPNYITVEINHVCTLVMPDFKEKWALR